MNAREKATSWKTHPEVLAQVEATNEGNKRKMSETKVDNLSTKQKCQHEEGRSRAMEYFEIIKEEKLTWADILFNSVKGGGCEWVAAVEGVEFGGGGRGASTVVSNQSIVEWRWRWGWSGAEGEEG
jgi:hypothetical protein